MSFKRYSNPLDLETVILRVNNQLVAMDQTSSFTLHSVQTDVPVPIRTMTHLPWVYTERGNGSLMATTLYNLNVVGNRVEKDKRPEDIVTMKGFFEGCEQKFGRKEKEVIFWKTFVGTGGEESAVVAMRLKASAGLLGYDGWALPNGDFIPLAEMRLVSFYLKMRARRTTTVIQRLYPEEEGGSLSTCLEWDTPLPTDDDDEGLLLDLLDPGVPHVVLGFILPKTGKYFVVDPFSLKFGVRREGYLFWWGDWDDYVEALPGTVAGISRHSWGPLKDNDKECKKKMEGVVKAEMSLKYGGRNFMKVAEEAVLASLLDKPNGCSFCGSFQNLKTCTSCQEAQYCDKWCQKSGWKAHREVCGNKKT